MSIDYKKLDDYLNDEFTRRKKRLIEKLKTMPAEFFQILDIDRQVLYCLLHRIVPAVCEGGEGRDEIRFLDELSHWYINAFLDDGNCEIVYEKIDLEYADYVLCNKGDRFASPTVIWSGNWDNRLSSEQFLEIARSLHEERKASLVYWGEKDGEVINHR